MLIDSNLVKLSQNNDVASKFNIFREKMTALNMPILSPTNNNITESTTQTNILDNIQLDFSKLPNIPNMPLPNMQNMQTSINSMQNMMKDMDKFNKLFDTMPNKQKKKLLKKTK